MKKIFIILIIIIMVIGTIVGCNPKIKKLDNVIENVNNEVEKIKQFEQDIEDGKIDEDNIPVIGANYKLVMLREQKK